MAVMALTSLEVVCEGWSRRHGQAGQGGRKFSVAAHGCPRGRCSLCLCFPVGRVGIIVPTQKVVRSQDRIGI